MLIDENCLDECLQRTVCQLCTGSFKEKQARDISQEISVVLQVIEQESQVREEQQEWRRKVNQRGIYEAELAGHLLSEFIVQILISEDELISLLFLRNLWYFSHKCVYVFLLVEFFFNNWGKGAIQ